MELTALTGLQIETELGRGAFTTVHLVRRDGVAYALKRPLPDAAARPGLAAAFGREAALLGCVDDPGVGAVHAAGTVGGVPALVLEYVPGGSLADKLDASPMEPERAVEIAAQLARGLAAAHRVGLVHRDVKPANIMVRTDGQAKLIDFGLALLGNETREDEAVGTFLYSAPEQAGTLKRPVDARSDLYSLGVVLFECLTGRLPFEAEDVGELLRMHLAAPVPDPAVLRPGLDQTLSSIVLRLLAKDPDDRFPDAASLLAALRECPGGEAAETPAADRWPLCGREADRERLAERWSQARAGRGGSALIRGGAGSGRTRLADEIASLARGAALLRAACREDEALPLAALRQAVEGHLLAVRALPAPRRAEAEQAIRDAAAAAGPGLIGRLSAGVAALLGEVAAEGRDEHVLAAVATFLGELATRSHGLLLVLDDAHRLDTGTREVLSRLAPDLPRLPLLVLRTEQDGAGEPVALAADTGVICTPLDAPAADQLIASRLPGATVSAELSEHVTARTGGSPLAIVAYLLRLLDAGLLTPLWGAWRLDSAGAEALPPAEGVRELLTARLAALPLDAREQLVTAAVAGTRFRTEMLIEADGEADAVVAAVAVATDRRIVEALPGGWYAFLHPMLREGLLDGVPEERLRALHGAVAGALESLPEPLRDNDHVYAVARHHRRAGDAVPPEERRRTSLAAGLQALDDQAPEEAVDYLSAAVDGDPAPPTEVLHALAIAYMRASRYADARSTLEKALGGESDRRERARLLVTRIELNHTVWDDTSALQDTATALAELRRPLPRNPFLLVVDALAVAAAGGVVRRTGIGFGTVSGDRRDDLATLAAVLGAGSYAAAIGLRVRESALLTLRALYAVNRLGPCPEYVRVYAQLGYVAGLVKLRGVSERCLDQAGRVAVLLGDPALTAYVEWMRGCAALLGGFDDGSTWELAITENERWYVPAQLLSGSAAVGLRLLLRGYTQQAQAEYERMLRRLPDPALVLGTSFSMLGVMVPAIQGRHVDAANALAALRKAFPPGVGTKVQRAHIIVAAACAAISQGEYGEPFEAVVAEFNALELRPRDMMNQHKWFYSYQSYGRLAQARFASGEARPAALAAAREAVDQLRRVGRGNRMLHCGYLIGEAALAQLTGDSAKAVEWADKADVVGRETDSPVAHFEVARIRARAFRALGMAGESDRQARNAIALATQYGWEQRRRQVRTEFGADEAAGTNRHTVIDRGDPGRNRRLEALQQVAVAAATVLDPQQLARVALDEMLNILGAERALFFLLDDSGEPVPFAARSSGKADLEETTAYGATLVRRVAESGEALVLTGTEQGAALGSRSAVLHGLRSILVAPVQFKGTIVGVVYLDSRLARGIFTDDDVEVLTSVAGHVAASLETAKAAQLQLAVQAARQQQAFAEMLRENLAELSAIHEPAALLRQLFLTLYGQVAATAGCLVNSDGSVVLEVAGSVPPSLLGAPLPLSIPTCLTPTVLPASFFNGGPDTTLAVPLWHRDGLAGVALLGGSSSDFDVQVAAALATQGMSAYDNARLFSRVQELATTDELTGQHNRRHFYAIAGALVQSAARSDNPLAAAMLDIDKFKSINDTYGHGVGDDVIRTVAARVRAAIRQSDLLGRYGGEEFAVVLPDHDGEAPALAERMRAAVAATPVETQAGPVPVTISVGLAALTDDDATLDQLLARADHALYRAKESGRNRVVQA